jgi:hypothetical protein
MPPRRRTAGTDPIEVPARTNPAAKAIVISHSPHAKTVMGCGFRASPKTPATVRVRAAEFSAKLLKALAYPPKGVYDPIAAIPKGGPMLHLKTRALALLVIAASLASLTGSAKGW